MQSLATSPTMSKALEEEEAPALAFSSRLTSPTGASTL